MSWRDRNGPTVMTRTLDFAPAAHAVAAVVRDVREDQLTDPTPCPAYTVADLLDHIDGLCVAFIASARKRRLPDSEVGPSVDGARLGEGWRDRIAARLAELAEVWREPAAYDGQTQAGPVELPASVAAQVALDEVVVHGWDLAVATGQRYSPDEDAVAACLEFTRAFETPPEAGEGPFGPPVAVRHDAPLLDQLLGATGRNPDWAPSRDAG